MALKHHKSTKKINTIDLDIFISVWKQRFHISVETTLLFVHNSVSTYTHTVRNNASFIIVNPITVDSIIFVGINFRKLKKRQVVDTHFRGLWNSTRSSFIE